jgi:hypothetical protein
VGSLLTFDIPQTALVATLDTYDFIFSLLQNLWFGGDVARIVGECACPHGMYFDNREMYCRRNFMGGTFGIIGLIMGILILVGCCCCGVLAFKKLRS